MPAADAKDELARYGHHGGQHGEPGIVGT
jgi:hypothetical protein